MKHEYAQLRRGLAVLAVGLLTATAATAQTDSTATGNADLNSAVDSLRQTVQQLQTQVAETQKDARTDRVWKRKKYVHLNYITSQTLTNKDVGNVQWKSSFGFALTKGTTYYLHRKPILGMIKIGLDWTQIDLTYVKYKDEVSIDPANSTSYTARHAGVRTTPDFGDDYEGSNPLDFNIDLGMQQIEYSMAIGPSVTVNPVDYLKVAAFFHYHPTSSVALLDSEASFAFVNGFAFGMSASWKAITLGFETRWDEGKYNKFDTDDINIDTDSEEIPSFDNLFSEKTRMKTKSFRVFFGFRF